MNNNTTKTTLREAFLDNVKSNLRDEFYEIFVNKEFDDLREFVESELSIYYDIFSSEDLFTDTINDYDNYEIKEIIDELSYYFDR